MSELNKFGQFWVDRKMDELDASEDEVHASIGAYDPEAFASYRQNEQARFTGIALGHQDDPEFQVNNTPPADKCYCTSCKDDGVLPDGSYCSCLLGREYDQKHQQYPDYSYDELSLIVGVLMPGRPELDC